MTPAKVKKKKWPKKNLGELISFIEQFHPGGVSLEVLAGELETTPQGVSNMFRRDDMKLSRAEEIVRLYGYELKIYYPVREFVDGYIPPEPKKHYPKAGNLSGLVKYIQDSEWSFSFVAEQSKLSPSTLTKAFTKGDILLSTLNNVVDSLGIVTVWRYEKQTI